MAERSKPYFFAFETERSHGKKGKVIAHCVRFETIEIEDSNFDETTFTLLGADYESDKRIRTMINCAKGFKPGK